MGTIISFIEAYGMICTETKNYMGPFFSCEVKNIFIIDTKIKLKMYQESSILPVRLGICMSKWQCFEKVSESTYKTKKSI